MTTEIKRNKDNELVAVLELTKEVIRKAFVYAIDNMDFAQEEPEVYALLLKSGVYERICRTMADLKKDFKN